MVLSNTCGSAPRVGSNFSAVSPIAVYFALGSRL